jgi:hypothetical protein
MSAATTPTTPPIANGTPVSPVEYVRSLPPEEKGKVLLALLREAMADNGDSGLMPIDDEEGKPFGYYVPPKAAEELYRLYGPQLTEEREREIDARIGQRGIPVAEVIADFKRQLAALQHQPR